MEERQILRVLYLLVHKVTTVIYALGLILLQNISDIWYLYGIVLLIISSQNEYYSNSTVYFVIKFVLFAQ